MSIFLFSRDNFVSSPKLLLLMTTALTLTVWMAVSLPASYHTAHIKIQLQQKCIAAQLIFNWNTSVTGHEHVMIFMSSSATPAKVIAVLMSKHP